ncbi:hypothetical protein PKB_5181 [Pseudomonas knackmussii B13]|uniref:Uncharacterized protein n=1 Tax=Pseudomonas knackmussii (strain DSM 6978 / CCUG 54928 / LMG 23759 / B13) TaxID=1301098 RepID=A0A024HPC9_PSEKB|nr:hypothetical protein PKB_5181 [Pseudomonas knackmussii B13]
MLKSTAFWVPAFAGMTLGKYDLDPVFPANAGTQKHIRTRVVHGNYTTHRNRAHS